MIGPQEIAEFFGLPHEPEGSPAPGVTASEGGGVAALQGGSDRSKPKEGGGFSYQEDEPRPSELDAKLRHPMAGQTGVLSHIDKEGRAAMVDVSRVGDKASHNNMFLFVPA